MLQEGNYSQQQSQIVELTEQSVLQAAAAHASKRMSREQIQILLEGPIEPDENVTFFNLTETIKNLTTQLETDVDALIMQKNRLSVASSEDAGKIDNVEDSLKGQNPNTQPEGSMVLEIGQTINSPAAPAPDAHSAVARHVPGSSASNTSGQTASVRQDAQKNVKEASGAEDDTKKLGGAEVVSAAASEVAENATTTAELQAKEKKEQERAKAVIASATARAVSAERRAAAAAEEIERLKDQIKARASAHGEDPAPSATNPATNSTPIADVAVVNLTLAIDGGVVDLESEVSTMSEQKHEVCWVTKNVEDRLKIISEILATVKC